ncbi:MAG: hypothetical protein ACKVOR_03160 [Flavobacteriales bacterium]
MATQTWHYAQNQFNTATRDNFKKGLQIGQYTDGVLESKQAAADPDDVAMYTAVHPVYDEYVTLYNEWKNAGGQQEGQTLNLKQLFALTKSRLDIWDPAIQIVHVKTSPEYKAIFPDGRTPFYSNNIDVRIEAFNTLQLALTNPALAATKAAVLTHYNALDAARDAQSGKKSQKATGSINLEEKRIELMELLYSMVGTLIKKHYKNPQLMLPYFALNILRESNQILFTGTLDAGEVEPVLIHTFLADDKLLAEAGPDAGFRLFLGQTAGEQNANGIILNAGEVREITISEFNAPDLSTYRYLTAVNTSAVETTYEIELL